MSAILFLCNAMVFPKFSPNTLALIDVLYLSFEAGGLTNVV